MDRKAELTANMMAAIDACRHDSDDRGLPEVASILAAAPSERVVECHRASEKIDRAVAGAIQEVPVPSGLAERILAGVHAHPSAPGAIHGQDLISDQELLVRPLDTGEKLEGPSAGLVLNGVVLNEAGKGAAWRPSRRLVVAGTLLTMAAGLLIALVLQWTRQRLDAGDLLAHAKAFYGSDDHSAPFSHDDPPFASPIGSVVGWRPVTFLSRAGAAFELSGRRRGTLYVIPLGSFRGPVLPPLPTTLPLLQGTSGITVGVWTNGTDVYVMVVEGDQRTFESFFPQKLA